MCDSHLRPVAPGGAAEVGDTATVGEGCAAASQSAQVLVIFPSNVAKDTAF